MIDLEEIEKAPLLALKISLSEITFITGPRKISRKLNTNINDIKLFSQDDVDGYFQFSGKNNATETELIYNINEVVERVNSQREEIISIKSQYKIKLTGTKILIFISYLLIFGIFFKKLRTNKKEIEMKIAIFNKVLNTYYLNIEFLINSDIMELYKHLQYTFREAANSQYIWEITSQRSINSSEERTLAEARVSRERTSFAEKKIDFFISKAHGMHMADSNNNFYILYPAFFVLFTGGTYELISYSDIDLSISENRFIDEECRPKDSEIIGYTYKYVRNDGEPDLRFSNNYKIPRMKYFELKLTIKGRTNVTFMFSNADTSENFARTLFAYTNLFKSDR
jgi:hypothetical protein